MTDETISGEQETASRVERDPIEKVDMTAELDQLRTMFREHQFRCLQSSGNGEIWAQNMGGMPGFKWQLMVDQGGRIRGELYNPRGEVVTMVNPADPRDVESACRMYVLGW